MEHSDKVLPYRGNSYQNKRRRKKKRQKTIPGSYRISILSRATRRGKQIPCHLIFPSSEDNLIRKKNQWGQEIEGERRTVTGQEQRLVGTGLWPYILGDGEGGERVSGGKVRGAAGRTALGLFINLRFCHLLLLLMYCIPSGSRGVLGYIRQFGRGSITVSKCDTSSLAVAEILTCTAVADLFGHCRSGSTGVTPRVC